MATIKLTNGVVISKDSVQGIPAPGIDTNNLIASLDGSDGSLTYTATQNCIVRIMGKSAGSWSGFVNIGNQGFIREDSYNNRYYLLPVVKGQTIYISGAAPHPSYQMHFDVFGVL